MESIDFVICRHEATRSRVFDSNLERKKVNFSQSSFRNNRIHIHSLMFLFVGNKVLYCCYNPVSCIPLMIDEAQIPDRMGSSEKDSNPRPPSGLRYILTVGPRRKCAPFTLVSAPIRAPAVRGRSQSQVAARAVPQGKQAALAPLKALVPRTPLGPSEFRMDGMRSLGIFCVCQWSMPSHVSKYSHRTDG